MPSSGSVTEPGSVAAPADIPLGGADRNSSFERSGASPFWQAVKRDKGMAESTANFSCGVPSGRVPRLSHTSFVDDVTIKCVGVNADWKRGIQVLRRFNL